MQAKHKYYLIIGFLCLTGGVLFAIDYPFLGMSASAAAALVAWFQSEAERKARDGDN